MEIKKIEDGLTGSEYADIESFTGLKVKVNIDQKILIPQMFDGPMQRIAGRGLPFNMLGIVALPITELPEGLRGLVQEDPLMGEVAKLVEQCKIDLARQPDLADVPMEILRAEAKERIGGYCVAAPGPEGIELLNSLLVSTRDMVQDMMYRNKPKDYIFFGHTLEIELAGKRATSIPTAGELQAKSTRTNFVRHDTTTRGMACRLRMAASLGITDADAIHNYASRDFVEEEKRMLAFIGATADIRRQKFALTATKITMLS